MGSRHVSNTRHHLLWFYSFVFTQSGVNECKLLPNCVITWKCAWVDVTSSCRVVTSETCQVNERFSYLMLCQYHLIIERCADLLLASKLVDESSQLAATSSLLSYVICAPLA